MNARFCREVCSRVIILKRDERDSQLSSSISTTYLLLLLSQLRGLGRALHASLQSMRKGARDDHDRLAEVERVVVEGGVRRDNPIDVPLGHDCEVQAQVGVHVLRAVDDGLRAPKIVLDW